MKNLKGIHDISWVCLKMHSHINASSYEILKLLQKTEYHLNLLNYSNSDIIQRHDTFSQAAFSKYIAQIWSYKK